MKFQKSIAFPSIVALLLFGVDKTSAITCSRDCKDGMTINLQSSETCESVATKNGLNATRFQELNPNINCQKQNSFIPSGTKVCVEHEIICPPGTGIVPASSGHVYYPLPGAASYEVPLQSINQAIPLSTFNATFPVCQPPLPVVENCDGYWNITTACNAAGCGDSGVTIESFTVLSNATVLGSPCPKTRTVPCVAPKCQCSNYPSLLSCSLRAENNNALFCQMTVEPLFGARFALNATSDLDIDVCELVFDKLNWNQPKIVKLNPIYNIAPYNRNPSYTIQYTAHAPGEVFHNCGGQIAGVRSVGTLQRKGVCQISGDPHVGIINENGWNPLTTAQKNASMSMKVPVHGLGTFWAVNSNIGLSIQVMYGRCMRQTFESFQPSCLIGVFIQYKNEFIRVVYQDNDTLNTTKSVFSTNLIHNSSSLSGHMTKHTITINDSPYGTWDQHSTVIELSSSHRAVNFTSATGVSSENTGMLSLSANLSPIHYQQIEGHCNVYDFSGSVRSSTEHLLFNRESVTRAPFLDNTQTGLLILNWTKSFEVEAEENGFLPTTAMALTFSAPNSCATNELKKRNAEKRSLDFNTGIIDSTINLVRTNTSISIDFAREKCKTCFALNSTILENIVHDDLMSCAGDFVLSGNDMFCPIHSLFAAQKLLTLSNSTQGLATDVVASLGDFQARLASSTCSGNGFKIDGTCYCQRGFSGMQCSVSISTLTSFLNGSPIPA